MNFRSFVSIVLRGFAMGAADIVPGVSGGTIALILGIYERLLASVRSGAGAVGRLIRGDVKGFIRSIASIEWGFVIPLGVGILAAVGGLSSLIDRLLEEQPESMAGLFFGLVVASVLIAWKMIEDRSGVVVAVTALVAVVGFIGLGYQGGAAADPDLYVYFFAGAVAICAMILPGISGSFLLLMMGMYGHVIGAIHERDLLIIAVFGAGAVVGLALFSTVLSWVLERYRDLLLAALVGLMVGSLRVLWPWPNGVGVHGEGSERLDGTALELPGSFAEALAPSALAVAAFFVVMFVSARAAQLPQKSA